MGSGLKATYDPGFGVVALGVWFLDFGFRDQVGAGRLAITAYRNLSPAHPTQMPGSLINWVAVIALELPLCGSRIIQHVSILW